MTRGKHVHGKGIDIRYDVVIEEADAEGKNYLGVLEWDDIWQEEMRQKKRDKRKETKEILQTSQGIAKM